MKVKKIIFCATILTVFFQCNGIAQVSFVNAPGSPFAQSINPRGNATGDFNGDGKLDLAIGDAYSNSISILLGVGNGSFSNAPGSPMASGSGPNSIAVSDFNNDGKLDICTANYVGSTMSVYLGSGNGSFTQAAGSPYPVGVFPYYVCIADFNLDGKPDIAEVNQNSNTVYIFLGQGNGSFTSAPSSPFSVGSSPYCVVTSDLNGDGKPDLVVVNGGGNNIEIYLGVGNGTFSMAPSSPIAVGNFPRLAAINDINNRHYIS